MTHLYYMRRALRLAGRGRTSPNPMVGAVVVKDGTIVGEGYHPKAGEPHAEVFALRRAGSAARAAVMYVTLEPCCHHGRTPPCTDAIVEAGIAEVHAAMADPDPEVSGRGLLDLARRGVKTHVGLCEDEARDLNAAYIKHRSTGYPLVVLKSAMSLDGRIATRTGDSKWITNEKARAYAHRLRWKADAIVVGANTARIDDPRLTARIGSRSYHPLRVVVTESCDLPTNLTLLKPELGTVIATCDSADRERRVKLEEAGARIITLSKVGRGPSIAELMRELGAMGCLSVLIEGGGEIAAAALAERVVDRVAFFYAPIVIGGRDAIPAVGGCGVDSVASAIRIQAASRKRFGDNYVVEGTVVYPDQTP